MSATVRVLIALDIPVAQASDLDDLRASLYARVEQEAGYLDDGSPVTPEAVLIAFVEDKTPIVHPSGLASVYMVGIEGLQS